MSASLPAVERLEDSTARLVEAASQISGLEHALARLLENSFEAGARCIRVSLRLSRLGFSVSDDGVGMSQKSMERLVSNTPISSRTSLALLGRLSSMHVVSRRHDCRQVFEINVRAGDCESPARISLQAHPPGTSICVAELFFNLPVRRKLLLSQKKNHSRMQGRLCSLLQRMALANPSVRWVLEDADQRKLLMRSRVLSLPLPSPLPRSAGARLSTPDTDLRRLFAHVYGTECVKSAEKFDEESGAVRLRALLWPFQSTSPNVQFMYVNGVPAIIPFVLDWLQQISTTFRRLLAGCNIRPLSYVLFFSCPVDSTTGPLQSTPNSELAGHRSFWTDASQAPLGVLESLRVAVVSLLSEHDPSLLVLPEMRASLHRRTASNSSVAARRHPSTPTVAIDASVATSAVGASHPLRKPIRSSRIERCVDRTSGTKAAGARAWSGVLRGSQHRSFGLHKFRCRQRPVLSTLDGGSGAFSSQRISFSREMLEQAHVVGQVACKFIVICVRAANGSRVLAALDQHATDERIRLEAMQAEVYSEGAVRSVMALRGGVSLEGWRSGDRRALIEYEGRLRAWGFAFKHGPASAAPHLIQAPLICGRVLGPDDALAFVRELSSLDGAESAKPPTVHALLCSKACRSAIMFGQELQRSECERLVRCLYKCKLPFQCAHGRPSVVPLALMPDRKPCCDAHPAGPSSGPPDSHRIGSSDEPDRGLAHA